MKNNTLAIASRLFGALMLVLTFPSERANAQMGGPSGPYSFVSDSDGGKAGKGSLVTLTFIPAGGTAIFNAAKPGENFTDQGKYLISGNSITISLPNLGISVSNQHFTLSGATLVLPFKVFSEGAGTSTWLFAGQGSGSKPPAEGPGEGPGTSTGTGTGSGTGTGTGTGTGSGTGSGTGTGSGHGTGTGTGTGSGTGTGTGTGTGSGHGTGTGTGTGSGTGTGTGTGTGIGPGPGPNQGTMDKLAGLWQGWGASYEVRFRRKNMMSLAVKHATLFTIGVNDQGAINGGGIIVYDLDPNLCGVAQLVNDTNMGINVLAQLPEFWQVGKELGEAYKLTGQGTALMQEKAAHDAAKVVDQEAVKAMGHAWKEFLHEANHFAEHAFMNILKEKFKQYGEHIVEKMGEDDKEEGEKKRRAGCTSVGPGTLGEASAQVGASAVKSLPIGPNMPMGVPMIPGVTQVQYNYKGLEHGPEQRSFLIEGNVGMWNGETRMTLKQSGDVFDGSKDLVVVYQVNYQTDKNKFPAWSPFTNKPGVIWMSNGPKTQEPPEQVRQLFQQMGAKLPTADGSVFAYMEDTGTHRNGVKPWEEYEYIWFVQKLDDHKVIEDFGK